MIGKSNEHIFKMVWNYFYRSNDLNVINLPFDDVASRLDGA